MAVLTELTQLEDRHNPTTTLEGWRRFIDADPAPFEMQPNDAWTALSGDARADYDEARIAHHAELSVVTTPAIKEITNAGRLLTLMNQRENGARRGLIVSGNAATGKTTAIKQLGRFHELRTWVRFPAVRAAFQSSTSLPLPKDHPGSWQWSSRDSSACR